VPEFASYVNQKLTTCDAIEMPRFCTPSCVNHLKQEQAC
jgi:hypothetical protein